MNKALSQLCTPCYIIDDKKFVDNLTTMKKCFAELWQSEPVFGYSVKTNHYPDLLMAAKNCGMLAEVVSDDEYRYAVVCGYPEEQIIFNGPQKSSHMLLKALNSGAMVNLDNCIEITEIKKQVLSLPTKSFHVGLRVNFDLEKNCPGETTAGNEGSRFGFCYENNELYNAIRSLNELGIDVSGLHMHCSTKTRSANVFRSLSEMASRIIKDYKLEDQIKYIDIGGGFFMGEQEITEGKPTPHEYAEAVCTPLKKVVDSERVRLILEPGAALLATAVSYLCTVINTREVRGTHIGTTDGSLLHINPFMSKRRQPADVLYENMTDRDVAKRQIICGSTCMENDRMLSLDNEMLLMPGDRVMFRCTGAYTMAFNNCFINLPSFVYMATKTGYRLLRDKNSKLMLEL